MEPEAGADPDSGGDLQLRHGEPAARRDPQDPGAAPGVRPGRRRQRLLLVPEPPVAVAPTPAADAGRATQRSGGRFRELVVVESFVE